MNRSAFRQKVLKNPEWFYKEVLGIAYWEKTLEMTNAVRDHRRVSVSGCTGSSKTFNSAGIAFWWLLSHYPSRVLSFAPGFRQVSMNLWGYIHSIHAQAKLPLGGEMLETTWRLNSEGWYATGFSTDDPNNLHGIHGQNDFILLDDAHGIQQPNFRALENSMASGRAHVLMLFNKNCLSGEAYDSCHSRARVYKHISIPAMETPNWKAGRVVIDGMITKDQAEEWIEEYGWDSDFVKVYVRDLFPSQTANTVIPSDWIDAAMKRDLKPEGEMILGADFGRMGGDRTVIAPMKGRVIFTPRSYQYLKSNESAGKLISAMDELNATVVYGDVIGVGGLLDFVEESGRAVVGVNVAERSPVLRMAHRPEKGFKFFRVRDEVWWNMREDLDPEGPDPIQLPNSPQLKRELTCATYTHNAKGEIVVSDKDAMKKILGKSPDEADGVNLANYGRRQRLKNRGATLVTVMTMEDD